MKNTLVYQATITRFYNVYGPHQLLEGGYTTLIGRWINNIQNGIQLRFMVMV
jgi:nucleoside-diphosphate-sugar epimerase